MSATVSFMTDVRREPICRRGVGVQDGIAAREAFLHELRAGSFPGVVLATCDRVECFSGVACPEPATVRHLFRVAAGLESPLLGENQILSQIKSAYKEAVVRAENGGFALSAEMHALFQSALRTGKRVRSETALNYGSVSHAHAALKLLENEFPQGLGNISLMVIGVNNLSRGFLRFVADRGNKTFFLGNRSYDKAQELCNELGGQAFPLSELTDLLPHVDVVVSATSAPHLIIHARHFTGFTAQQGPALLVDLAVPRDIDPDIAGLPGRRVFNVHHLEALMAEGLNGRQAAIADAEAIIAEEMDRFYAYLSRRQSFKHTCVRPVA